MSDQPTPSTNNDKPELTAKQIEKKKKREAAKAAKLKKIAEAKKRKAALQQKQKEQEQKKRKTDNRSAKKFVNPTPPGEKKDLSGEMQPAYDPPQVEAVWYDWWRKQGYFKPKPSESKEKFVIVIPPPNVTGALHLGHALTNSIQDVVCRWHRMSGREVLWVPGTDHAGIATQVRVEKKLMLEQKKTRHDIGREAFVEEVWKWKNQFGGRIQQQLMRLGSSLDWDREVFTLDDKLSVAVKFAFIKWYKEGLIFRAKRLVNWCCALNTAIADIEVDHVDLDKPEKWSVPNHPKNKKYDFGVIVSFAYKVIDSDEELVVATTRIETMLGDTAVAVHPEDTRYKHLIGKQLKHPFVDRTIPIIGDSELVDMNFGTGAVKVTPAHDPNDYACGERNNLEFINLLNDDGTYNSNAGKYAGMLRFEIRTQIIKDLEELGLYRGVKPNKMAIGVCSRSGDVIEPRIKNQWFVNCKEMGKEAIRAVDDGELEIIPSMHIATWKRWLEDVHDWCISRQLWWGHRIPAYEVFVDDKPLKENEETFVIAETQEEALAEAKAKYQEEANGGTLEVRQDPDVLDTWFSSGLFPFSVFGWPEQTEELGRFYPTSLLETGHDILFFWVARMVMMGQSLTGKLPFKQIYLHAMVRDAMGKKMSKSKGNVVDPIDVIEGATLDQLSEALSSSFLSKAEVQRATKCQKQNFPRGISECGTDAMRFALCDYTKQGKNINLNVDKVVADRNFCNKIWQAVKYFYMKAGDDFKPSALPDVSTLSIENQWILSCLAKACDESNEGIRTYDFPRSTQACRGFIYDIICNVFIEVSKEIYNSDDQKAKDETSLILYTGIEAGLRLIHPYMPFITEELWQRLPKENAADSIMIAPYPTANEAWANEQLNEEMEYVLDVIHKINSLKGFYKIPPQKRPTIALRFNTEEEKTKLSKYMHVIKALTLAGDLQSLDSEANEPKGSAITVINEHLSAFVQILGLGVDLSKELQKIQNTIKKINVDIKKTEQKILKFNEKIPMEVQEKEKAKLATQKAQLEASEEAKTKLEKLLQEESDDQ